MRDIFKSAEHSGLLGSLVIGEENCRDHAHDDDDDDGRNYSRNRRRRRLDFVARIAIRTEARILSR